MNARMPRLSSCRLNSLSSAGLPADRAQPRGLPTKICRVSQPIRSACTSAPATSPLPTWTWVPIGLRMTREPSPSGDPDLDRRALRHPVAAVVLLHHEAEAEVRRVVL